MSPLEDRQASIDANVILDFHLTGNMAVLVQSASSGILVSDFVEAELTKADAAVPTGSSVVHLTTEEQLNFYDDLQRTYPRLGAGELGAICVARFKHAMLVSNDRQAREAGSDLGLEVMGTLGILRSAVDRRAITPVRAVEIMEAMLAAGAWFSEELIDVFRTSVLKASRNT